MSTSRVLNYGGSGGSLFVKDGDRTITGAEAKQIFNTADFVCLSAFKDGRGEWIIHAKNGGGNTIQHRRNGQYDYLANECERLAGRDGLTILYC